MAAFFRFYQKSFNNRPIITLICTNASLNALGDVVAQTSQITVSRRDPDNIEILEPSYDPLRTARFAAFGAIMGPLIGRWAKFLEHRFPLRLSKAVKKASMSAVVKRVASDQFVMAPIGLAIFLGSMSVMEGRSTCEMKQKYTALFGPALLANWTVWPFAQMVNFRYMPLAYRVPFQSTCGVFWTLYLSLLNSRHVFHSATQNALTIFFTVVRTSRLPYTKALRRKKRKLGRFTQLEFFMTMYVMIKHGRRFADMHVSIKVTYK
ncbi:hypothetical protein BU17DRAFT_39234 [Hysterangium stoloniferum]|nr:hypothetical protein BU17DRAFT_39234 [Hysterangium stoloniferum]